MNPPDMPETIERTLGRTLPRALREATGGTGCIVVRGSIPLAGPDHDGEPLTEARPLSAEQFALLLRLLLDPASHRTYGRFRRFPPSLGFRFRLDGPSNSTTVAVDLHNPGWRIVAGGDSYWGIHSVGPEMRELAQAMFPEFAAKSKRCVWGQGLLPKRKIVN